MNSKPKRERETEDNGKQTLSHTLTHIPRTYIHSVCVGALIASEPKEEVRQKERGREKAH